MHFVRHGQSHFNLAMRQAGRDPGIIDAGLTPQGFQQAALAAEKLEGQGVDHIICSPYTRAIETASVIADKLKLSLHIEPLAGERSIYSCDIGTPASALKEKWQHLDFSHIGEKWWPDNEESHTNLTRRAMAFIKKWQGHMREKNLVLVSHYYFLNQLTGHDFSNGEVHFKKLL